MSRRSRRRGRSAAPSESSVSSAPSSSGRAPDDDQPSRSGGRRPARPPAAGARTKLSCGRRRSRLAGADDPPDEEVEQHEEGDLQEEQRLVDGDGVRASRLRLGFPPEDELGRADRDRVAAARSFARCWRRPFTSMPFVESRSTIQYAAPSWRSSAWRARDVRVGELDVAVLRAADHHAPLVDLVLLAVHVRRDDLLREAELLGVGGLRRRAGSGGRPSSRRAAAGRLRRAPAAGRAPLHHPRRDPELADARSSSVSSARRAA